MCPNRAARSAVDASILAQLIRCAETNLMDAPQVRYAQSGDVSIAYAVVGDGPFDLIFVGGWIFSSLEFAWDGPPADFFGAARGFLAAHRFRQAGNWPVRPNDRRS